NGGSGRHFAPPFRADSRGGRISAGGVFWGTIFRCGSDDGRAPRPFASRKVFPKEPRGGGPLRVREPVPATVTRRPAAALRRVPPSVSPRAASPRRSRR